MTERTQTLKRLMVIGGVRCGSEDKITCYPAYDLEDGSKVWRHIETGEQFVRIRLDSKYYFVSVFGGES